MTDNIRFIDCSHLDDLMIIAIKAELDVLEERARILASMRSSPTQPTETEPHRAPNSSTLGI